MTERDTGKASQHDTSPRVSRRLTLPADQQASRRLLPATLGSDRARHIEPCKTMRLLPSSPPPILIRALHALPPTPDQLSRHQRARLAGYRRTQALTRLAVVMGFLHG